jgi:lipopolysaccharide transport system ATP-binding protein
VGRVRRAIARRFGRQFLVLTRQDAAPELLATPPAISASDLSKRYARDLDPSLRYGFADIVGELNPWRRGDRRLRNGEFWALDGVSFELGAGEALGVIGRNGAGKSTLLRLVYGLSKPDRGGLQINGAMGALISLGSAFSAMLTGREAIRTEATLLAIPVDDIADLEARVIEFSELADVIDEPIGTYSLGMRMRLGYAVASQLRPDILLIDEVLFVGDLAFQHKCIAHVKDHLARGGSLVLVSHDMWMIQEMCERVLYLDHGRSVFLGDSMEGVNKYLHDLSSDRSDEVDDPLIVPDHSPVKVLELTATGDDGEIPSQGRAMEVACTVDASEAFDVRWGIEIASVDQPVALCSASSPTARPIRLVGGVQTIRARVPTVRLVGGHYYLKAAVFDATTGQLLGSKGWNEWPTVLEIRSEAGMLDNLRRIARTQLTMSSEVR